MGKKIELSKIKYYGPNPNKKTGEPPTLTPGMTVRGLEYLETAEAKKSMFPGRVNHVFLQNGENVVFNGSSMLDALVAKIKPGDKVNIKYVGIEKCPFGKYKGRNTHAFEMEYFDENEDIITTEEEKKETVSQETPVTENAAEEPDAF